MGTFRNDTSSWAMSKWLNTEFGALILMVAVAFVIFILYHLCLCLVRICDGILPSSWRSSESSIYDLSISTIAYRDSPTIVNRNTPSPYVSHNSLSSYGFRDQLPSYASCVQLDSYAACAPLDSYASCVQLPTYDDLELSNFNEVVYQDPVYQDPVYPVRQK